MPTRILRFFICQCQELGMAQGHVRQDFVNTLKRHYTHHHNIGVLLGVVGLAGAAGITTMIHELKNPEVSIRHY